ncbi:MAG: hypothetical protein WCY01_03390 [Alkalispirochaeta sp.]|jgi:hypothetical protein
MKTTIDIPNGLYTEAKGVAAARGISFRRLVLEALEKAVRPSDQRGWIDSFGTFAAEPEIVYGVDRVIEEELSSVDPGEWQ